MIDKIKEIVELKIKAITEKDIKLQNQKIEALENIFTGVAEKPDFDDGEIFNYVKDYDSCIKFTPGRDKKSEDSH